MFKHYHFFIQYFSIVNQKENKKKLMFLNFYMSNKKAYYIRIQLDILIFHIIINEEFKINK